MATQSPQTGPDPAQKSSPAPRSDGPRTTDAQGFVTDLTGPLRTLAQAHGVQPEYASAEGEHVRVSDATLTAVLSALGVPCSTRAEIDDGLRALEEAPFARALPPFGHQWEGESAELRFTVPEGQRLGLSLLTETGTRIPLDASGPVLATRTVMEDGAPRLRQSRAVTMPADLPVGEHVLTLTYGHEVESMSFLVAPRTVPTAAEAVGARTPSGASARRPWGVTVQLYSVRSQQSWGIGDFGDLRDLMAISAGLGADFVLINPIHAQAALPPVEDSPYLPSSRQAIDPIYLRIEDIPEIGRLDAVQRRAVEVLERRWGVAAAQGRPIERDDVLRDKLTALRILHRLPMGPARRAEFDRFRAEAPEGMRAWAVFNAIAVDVGGSRAKVKAALKEAGKATGKAAGKAARSSSTTDEASRTRRILSTGAPWPERMTGPDAPAVQEFAAEHAAEVEFWLWTQFVAAEQLRAAQSSARTLGMRIGLVTDLAVGVSGSGADAWALADHLATGATVGAPADYYNQQGQDWSQPPWHPQRLAEAGYRPLRDLFRTAFTGAGGIRIDHVMGLFRLWWVPAGASAKDGAYVVYDSEAILAVLALEARRAGVLVIGEDLGTVAPGVRERLAELGVLGTSVLWFEQDEDGPRDPADYRPLSLATLGTHDMHPMGGYLNLADIDLSQELGLLDDDYDAVLSAERTNRQTFLKRVAETGVLEPTDTMVGTLDDPGPVVLGLHEHLATASSQLVGVALADVVGETRAQNKPGTSSEYPNWVLPLTDTQRSAVLIEDLEDHDGLRAVASVMNAAGRMG